VERCDLCEGGARKEIRDHVAAVLVPPLVPRDEPQKTYTDPKVRKLIWQRYVAVSVDADSDPALASRYGDWGWPATIIFAPDGTEIVKLRGFYSPQFFNPILTATIDDPSPVVYPDAGGAERERTLATGLTDAQRQEILAFIDQAWDGQYGGWSKSKFVDGQMLIWALQRAAGRRQQRGADQESADPDGRDHGRRHRRYELGQSEARLVGAGAGISDVRAGGRACCPCRA
jgi:hypothetical protein